MPIPDFQTIMLPMLRLAGEHAEQTMPQAREALAEHFGLTPEELAIKLPSGRQTTFSNRVAWAKVHLGMAGLLESPRRGSFRITPDGATLLQNPPERITIKFLEQYPSFLVFRSSSGRADREDQRPLSTTDTPEEMLETAYQQLRGELSTSLLQRITNTSWVFFEQLVVNLLVAMGYGGSVKDAGHATRKTGDEGIDGIIKQDRLGLDTIYLQAKKWNGVVGRPEIQKFVGALHGQRARKGIFITTGRFSHEAMEYARHIDPKVVLIDGDELAQLMIDYDLGVSPVSTYIIKRLDTDYFAEE